MPFGFYKECKYSFLCTDNLFFEKEALRNTGKQIMSTFLKMRNGVGGKQ